MKEVLLLYSDAICLTDKINNRNILTVYEVDQFLNHFISNETLKSDNKILQIGLEILRNVNTIKHIH